MRPAGITPETPGLRRILVVEDDPETAEQLVDFLAASGYEVDLARDGNDGLSRGRSSDYAVMTIDRMLPGIDGIGVIRRLREGGIRPPALIVGALGEVDDRVRGSYWPASRRSPGAAQPLSRKPCASAILSSISCHGRPFAGAEK